jgi:hypothetical protein
MMSVAILLSLLPKVSSDVAKDNRFDDCDTLGRRKEK